MSWNYSLVGHKLNPQQIQSDFHALEPAILRLDCEESLPR